MSTFKLIYSYIIFSLDRRKWIRISNLNVLFANPLTFETIPKSEITTSIEDLDHLCFHSLINRYFLLWYRATFMLLPYVCWPYGPKPHSGQKRSHGMSDPIPALSSESREYVQKKMCQISIALSKIRLLFYFKTLGFGFL